VQNFAKETNLDASEECAGLITDVIPMLMRILRCEIGNIRPADITVPQLRTMACLQAHAGISLTELAEHLGFLPSSASKVVDQLLTRDLLTRQIDPSDRRRAILTLTPAGLAALDETRSAIQAFIGKQLAQLSPDKLSTISDAMLQLQQIFAPTIEARAQTTVSPKTAPSQDQG
jgi:DNA-binding MarR family transcriptional regulator